MPKPGIYHTNATGETVPLAVEGGDGDKLLLVEALQEQLTEEEQENLCSHLGGFEEDA